MVYSLSDFKAYSPHRKAFALFGDPVSHSVSPALHRLLAEASGQEIDYIAVLVWPEELAEAIAIARDKLSGFNLTIPHKIKAMPLVDELSASARRLGSINTVLVRDGRLTGHNTDLPGFSHSLEKDGISPAGRDVLLLGCGGVSRVMAHHCLSEGALSLTIAARNREKALSFRSSLAAAFEGKCIFVTDFKSLPAHASLVLNATPVGMTPDEEKTPIDALPTGAEYVYDAIYNPPATRLLRLAAQRGIPHQDGLYMLVMQAAVAQDIWLSNLCPEEKREGILLSLYGDLAKKRLAAVHQKRHLILSGFMGSGKTTVGRRVSKQLSLPFYDLDAMAEARAGRSISALFEEAGEAAFRDLESALCRELEDLEPGVVATGGGVLGRAENALALRASGFVVFLNPPFDAIERRLRHSEWRPLWKAHSLPGAQKSLFDQRLPAYHAASDLTVEDVCLRHALLSILRGI